MALNNVVKPTAIHSLREVYLHSLILPGRSAPSRNPLVEFVLNPVQRTVDRRLTDIGFGDLYPRVRKRIDEVVDPRMQDAVLVRYIPAEQLNPPRQEQDGRQNDKL